MFSYMTKPQLPNMQQTVANTILIINISNSNKPQQVLSSHLHTPGSYQSSLLNRSEWVSQWVSESVSHWQALPKWSDSGPIKIRNTWSALIQSTTFTRTSTSTWILILWTASAIQHSRAKTKTKQQSHHEHHYDWKIIRMGLWTNCAVSWYA